VGFRVEGVYRNTNLKQYLDSIFIMGYDYHWRESSTTGPVSPYNDPATYDVVDTVNISLNYYDKQQLILGLPFYGYDWKTVSGQPKAGTIGIAKSVDLSWTNYIAPVYGRLWDSSSNTPWYRYKDGDTWHQVWYDDDKSIGLKYDYAKSKNLGGVGFYALGLEGNNSTIWNIFLPNLFILNY
jgi:spore germination protein YaaH